MTDIKRCIDCGESKPIGMFTKRVGRCKPCNAARMKAYRKARPEWQREQDRKQYYKDREKSVAKVLRWKLENKANAQAIQARRLNNTPAWGGSEWEMFATTEAYMLRDDRTAATGVKHEVDHIVPTNGEIVSGLHVASNLRVVDMSENKLKGNRYAV